MLAPGVEDELLEFAGGRVHQFEDQVAAGDRLQPVGDEAAVGLSQSGMRPLISTIVSATAITDR